MTSRWLYFRQWLHLQLRRQLIHPVCSKLYRDTNRDTRKSMMVAGTARSGTTWVAEIVSSQIPCRVMFEPFHARCVSAFSQFNYFQYMRPGSANDELFAYCQRVFSGNIRHSWIDREVEIIFPQFRVIKEIRANLFLKWIREHFPEMPVVFVVRHPCAVVLSRMQLDWATDVDVEPFLSQEELVNDFLSDKMDIIRNAKTPEQKHAIVWCISNLVPLRQFDLNELNVIFYENLCARPEVEIPRIFEVIGHEYKNTVFASMDRPSRTSTRSSAVMTGDDKVTQWKRILSPKQIDDILSVVEAFGLDHIYGDSFTPDVKAQYAFQEENESGV